MTKKVELLKGQMVFFLLSVFIEDANQLEMIGKMLC